MNKVILTGRITKDPEIRATQNGISTLTFTLAVDRGYKDLQGNNQTDFISCVAWRQQAEFMSMYVKKGYLLAIEGQIQTRSYLNNQNQTVYVTEVVADRVENLTPRDNAPQQNNAPKPNNQIATNYNDLPF